MARRDWLLGVGFAVVALLACRQVTLHGAYAPNSSYRAQVDALLDGQLALSAAPEALRHDLAWTPRGVQQVWGLGVPLWQLPFEALGRLVGYTPFPDRVALAAWLAVMLVAMLRGLRALAPPGARPRGWIEPAGALLVTALLPAFVTMLRCRIGVYEEAAIYAYGAALILLGGLLALQRAPTATRYVLLLAFAGATGLFRPTVWFYGLASAAIATVIFARAQRRAALAPIALGVALFVAGGGALFASNALRFGRGTEFGHRLNVHSLPGNIVATRFSYPFERVGLGVAAEELVGSLFDRPEQRSKRGFYQRALHRGQADAPRWREYYFTTFSWPYVPVIVAGLVLGALAWRRRGDPRARLLVAWAVLGGAPLAVFYLRSPSVSSRYQLDLAPAIAALLVITWRAVAARWPRGGFAVLAALWLAAVATSKISRPRGISDPLDRATAAALTDDISHAVAYDRALPGAYDLADPYLPSWTDVLEDFVRCTGADGAAIACDAPPLPGDRVVRGHRVGSRWQLTQAEVPDAARPEDDVCTAARGPADDVCPAAPSVQSAAAVTRRAATAPLLYLNAVGWDLTTGAVPPATMFYVDDPADVVLDLLGPRDTDWAHAARVMIDLDLLRLVAIAETADGAQLRFAGRPHPGLQVAFVAFGPDTALDQPLAAVRLRAIRWRP